MVTIGTFRKSALSFPEATEEPHFEKTSFRVRKKIFATYDAKHKRACVKLSEVDQHVFSAVNNETIYPVANKWGKQGWTFIEMQKINKPLFTEILIAAYCEVAPLKLSQIVKSGQ